MNNPAIVSAQYKHYLHEAVLNTTKRVPYTHLVPMDDSILLL